MATITSHKISVSWVPPSAIHQLWFVFFSTGLWKINEICAANWSLWQGKLCNEIDLCKSNTTTYTPPQLQGADPQDLRQKDTRAKPPCYAN